MKKLFRMTTWMLIAFMSIMSSCDKQEPIEQSPQKPQDGDIAVGTEIIVDGENVTNTRAASEAGYTTGDGLYDSGDPVTVAAFANDGYELVRFYDKGGKTDQQNGSSYTFPASIPQTFKAEFARKFTISASASPSDGGTVAGGGKYKNGASCTLTATPKSGYTFDGWYEGSTKVSSNSSYSFTVSSNRTMTAKFTGNISIIAKNDNNILYLSASEPVQVPITTVCEITQKEWRQDYPDDPPVLVFEETYTVIFSMPVGAKISNKEEFKRSAYPETDYYIDNQDHSAWNNKTVDGITYRLENGW